MAFYVGQKVVCVDVSGLNNAPWNTLKAGQTYTIARITPAWGKLYVDVAEGPLSPNDVGAFYASRFRPVVERKTDISSLVALLNPANHKHLEATS